MKQKRKIKINKSKRIKLFYYCNRFNCYEQYKSHVLLYMIKFHRYKDKETALKDYAYYENEFSKEFNKKEGFTPKQAAFAVTIGYWSKSYNFPQNFHKKWKKLTKNQLKSNKISTNNITLSIITK